MLIDRYKSRDNGNGVADVLTAPVIRSLEPASAAPLDDASVDARVEALLQRMTLPEKLGQLTQYAHGHATGPGMDRGDHRRMIADGRVGSILNATGVEETNELQRIAIERSRLKIPLLFGLDVIHGYRTTFPVPLALSATWNPALVERTAAVAAREASADGVRWTLAPVVDVARDPRWGRVVEGTGEDPYLAAVFGRAYVRGYQGERLGDPYSIAACAKHFVGYGAAEAGRDYNSTEISDRTLRDVYLPPFEACLRAGVLTFMSGFHAVNGIPTSANAQLLRGILRDEWGFRGFVVSDWAAVNELIAHGVSADGATAARKALLAGVDMDMESGLYLNELPAEVRAGRVPESAVDEAARRVLRVKFALGLFERPYAEQRIEVDSSTECDVELAREAAEESIVLLKNDGVLPLPADGRAIALIGPLANAPAEMLGSWIGRGDACHVVTLRTAFAEYCGAAQIPLLFEMGCDITGGSEDGIAVAVEVARRADVVVLALGESADMSGEGACRTQLTLPGLQKKLLDAVAAAGKPVVLVVFSGRPLVLTPYVDKVAAVVQAWLPGIQGGPALVRLLTGQANFSGRLTMSMPRSIGQLPIYYNHLNTGRPAYGAEHKYVSCYLDESNDPLFAFGFGLSYTTFQYSRPSLSTPLLSARAVNDGVQSVNVTCQIRNIGIRDGAEVAQLYVRQRGTSVARPVRELKGFHRVSLRGGESRSVRFTLGKDDLAFWNNDMRYTVEPAAVTVWVAKDARSGEGVELTITE
jgi:beta-glucosidase